MAKTRQQKEAALTALSDKLQQSKGVVFAQFTGLSVETTRALRAQLRQSNTEMVVAKKPLVGLMLQGGGLDAGVVKQMDGSVAIVFGYDDEVAPAKTIAEFAKDREGIAFHGGILDGNYIDAAKVTELSALPSKTELLAKLVGSLKSPTSGLVNVLNGNLRGLVQVLSQIKDQKTA